MNKIYTNIYNTGNQFYVFEGKRSKAKDLALETLQNLEKAFSDGLKYQPDKSKDDPLKGLSNVQLRYQLLKKAEDIFNGFNKKVDNLKWYQKFFCYFRIQAQKEKVKEVFERLRQTFSPPLIFGPGFDVNISHKITTQYLEFNELNTLSHVNKQCESITWLPLARLLGYEGYQTSEAKELLNNIDTSIKALVKQNKLAKRFFVYREGVLDAKALYFKFLQLEQVERHSCLYRHVYNLACEGNVEILKPLLKLKVNVNGLYGEDDIPLLGALSNRKLDAAELLIQHGADINVQARYETALLAAIHPRSDAIDSSQELRIIKLLLENAANILNRDRYNETALHRAVKVGREDIVSVLIEKAPILMDLGNDSDQTPLHIAASLGNKDIVDLLLKNAPPERVNRIMKLCGSTALHLAAQNGHAYTIQALLQKDPSLINVADFYGFTALHYATEEKHFNIVALLLEHSPQALYEK